MQLAFTTADELARLLEEAGEPLDYREIWPRVFALGSCPPDLMHTLVDDLIREDERFSWESSVHIGLASWRERHRDLADVAFTVVDLETTGSTPGYAKITEIGAVRIEGGAVAGEFAQLVDPRRPISRIITGLTGITNAMVAGAPTIEQALPKFADFARGSVLVAHNAKFDLSFLDYELSLLTGQTFSRPVLDTMRMARRLWPQMRSALSALSERFGTAVRPCHRALSDAQATAELLLIFLARLQEDGLRTLEDVVRFCEIESRRNYHKIVLTESLPACPGVYIMRDAGGAPLYVGKAESLRRRTRDHFLQKQAHGARQALELLESFDVMETGSEFEALLLEGRLIGDLCPPYNERGTHANAYHYVKLSNERYPRLYVTPNRIDDGSFYAGPFRSRAFARRLTDCLTGVYPLRTCARLPGPQGEASGHAAALPPAASGCARFDMGACLAPCRAELDGSYTEVVLSVRRVLEGDDAELQRRLEERMRELVAGLAFEKAAKLQEQREAMTQAVRLVRRLRAALAAHAVLVYPGREVGTARVWGVAGGALVAHEEVVAGEAQTEWATSFLTRGLAAPSPTVPLPPETIDEILLVESWLRRHRKAVNVLDLPAPPHRPDERRRLAEALAGELLRRVRTVVAP
jgi:DNA polymerase-3 subunit epsilon